MKRFLVILPLLSIACADPPPAQAPLKATRAPLNTIALDWEGVGDRMYFMQASMDLVSWFYLGIIEPGQSGFIHGYGMETDGEKVFWKLRWSDRDPANPNWENDCDGDGLGNRFEVMYGYDPLAANPAELGDGDDDGLLNTNEEIQERNPKVKDHPAVKLGVVAGS